MNENELYHHGVKGMKWGHRKKYPTSDVRNRVNSTKAEYKSANKAYNKSYRKAYANSARHPVSQFVTKKGKAKSDALWEAAANDAKRVNSAKSAYKSAKKEHVTTIKAKKAADKAQKKLAKTKLKDLYKEYHDLEDQITYGKKADAKANARIEKRMIAIDEQASKLENKLKKH